MTITLPPALARRVARHAKAQQQEPEAVALALLTAALDGASARSAGGAARWEGTTAKQRSEAASAAATKRWASKA
jgi:hypothetical protein